MEPEFAKLPAEKRRRILQSAMEEFARSDYKSANTEIIAARAQISKGALFYYFKNKKSLYMALIRHAGALIEKEMQLSPAAEGEDLFDYLDRLVDKKVAVLEKYPALVQFSVRVFYSGGTQVSPAIDRFLLRYTDTLFDRYLSRVDTSRYRAGFTPRRAIDLLMYLTDGYMHAQLMAGRPADMRELYRQYRVWQAMVRDFVYKKEEPKEGAV